MGMSSASPDWKLLNTAQAHRQPTPRNEATSNKWLPITGRASYPTNAPGAISGQDNIPIQIKCMKNQNPRDNENQPRTYDFISVEQEIKKRKEEVSENETPCSRQTIQIVRPYWG